MAPFVISFYLDSLSTSMHELRKNRRNSKKRRILANDYLKTMAMRFRCKAADRGIH